MFKKLTNDVRDFANYDVHVQAELDALRVLVMEHDRAIKILEEEKEERRLAVLEFKKNMIEMRSMIDEVNDTLHGGTDDE